MRFKNVIEQFNAKAMLGRNRRNIAQTKTIGLIQPRVLINAFMLVGNDIDRLLAFAQPIGKMVIKWRQTRTGIDQEKRNVRRQPGPAFYRPDG